MMAVLEITPAEYRVRWPPLLVLTVLVLLTGQFVIALVRISLMTDSAHPYQVIRGWVLISAVCLPWMYGLWRKRNWVRWLTVISAVTGCAMTPLNLARLHDPVQVICYWLQFALTIPVVIILMLPAVGDWYTRSPRHPGSPLTLRVVLWGAPLAVAVAWLAQWHWHFPRHSLGASITAMLLVLGSVVASVSAVFAIYRLVRTPSSRSILTFVLVAINALILIGVLLVGISLTFTIAHARQTLESGRVEYNTVRPHSSLGNLVPEQYAQERESPESA
jgi:hypothetical protein